MDKNETTSRRVATKAARVLRDRNASSDAKSVAASALSQAPDDARTRTVASSPNVKLAGEAEPLGAGPVTVGMAIIGELPDAEAQRTGFYFPEPMRLIRLFPERFKLLVEKGKQ